MPLDHPRIHAASVLARAIEAALPPDSAHPVWTASDAGLSPDVDGPLTVVQATSAPAGHARWLWLVDVTLVTHGETPDAAWDAHAAAADALLDLRRADFDAGIIVSGASCTQEPDDVPGRPQDWAQVRSNYTLTLRSA